MMHDLCISMPSLLFHGGSRSGLFRFFHSTTKRENNAFVADAALEIRNLSFSYGRKSILRQVSLNVRRGEICGLLGPNGSGKSTLFRCCMGFLHPQQGHIHVKGVSIAHMPPAKLARYVAYVPQEHRQPFPFLVRDMVLMGRSPHMTGFCAVTNADKAIVGEAMERIGISALANTAFNQLSGGQRQMVLIARAMAQQTPLILLDEPTSALDFRNQIAVWRVLRDVAEHGVAILVCCHDPNHILWFCDRAAVLYQGSLLSEGSVGETLSQDTLQHVYGEECIRISTASIDMVCPQRS